MKLFGLLIIIIITVTMADSAYIMPQKMGLSPYSLGTGNAFPSLPDGSSAVFSNPAFLKMYKYNEVKLLGTKYYADVSYYAASTMIQTKLLPIGIGLVHLKVADVYSTYLDSNLVIQKGALINYSNNAFAIGTAFDVLGYDVGLSTLIYSAVIDNNSSFGVNISVGLYKKILKELLFSAYLENALPRLGDSFGAVLWKTGYVERTPASLVLGVKYSFLDFEVAPSIFFYDLYANSTQGWNISTSYTLGALKIFGSYGVNPLKGIDPSVSVGIAVDLNLFDIQYSMAPSNIIDSDVHHYVATSVKFSNEVFKNDDNSVEIVTENITIEQPIGSENKNDVINDKKTVDDIEDAINVDNINDIL